ncbi:MAG: thioredoxin domain-containing protein [Burkholderiales bacterium]|nr:thioredoxin domain-containing protein [Burkholderiales bacterium]
MPNRLARETSPYLQQHADNPVEWYPWGAEALDRARAEDKPILLSIGYSACHWCHVMAHESFEDADVATLMNRLYVNIKVDREERPDLDQIYQSAHYLLTRRSGGWPLTLFLTPDQVAFAGGTYFPKEPRHGIPGFKDLLARIAEVFRTRRAEIAQQNASLVQALALPRAQPSAEIELDAGPIEAGVRELSRLFDPRDGGLGKAPKFPHPYEFDFLLRRHAHGDDTLAMVTATLRQMAQGGIFDQIGGGFCRYSVDERWTIPHFEKMLYDNGPLLALYADAWRATGEALFARVVEQTARWAMREMQASSGGYYSSLDADSEHEEGKYYVWTPDEVRACLSEQEWSIVEPHYGLDRPPNFEHRHWHLRVAKPLADIAQQTHRSPDQCEALLESARAKLFAQREQRVRPGRDEKILTSWNALMVRGMARAGREFARTEWIVSAQRSVDFIRTVMWRNRRLYATHRDGKTQLNAYLDDHAFLLDALIVLMQAQFRICDLDFARELADAMLERFEDTDGGGFFFTSHDHEQLIQRTKPAHDNATPAGNGVAAVALQRLGHLLGEASYLQAAARTLRLLWPQLQAHPSAATTLLIALDEHLDPPVSVLLRGPATGMAPWEERMRERYRPHVVALAIPNGTGTLPPALSHPDSGEVNAWICRGVNCLAPLNDPARLPALLERGPTR